MRVAAYIRVSTDEQAEKGTSLETQSEQLQLWAKSLNHEVYDQYVDRGYSASNDDRPELRRLMADARQHKFDAVVTTKLDRFFRNLRLLLKYHDDLKALGIRYIATENSLDTSTPFGRVMFQFIGVFAEWEKEEIKERNQKGIRKTLEKQLMAGGKHLFGYARGADKKPVKVEAEAAVVKLIYQLYLSGLGVSRAAERLNQSKEKLPKPSARSKGWNDSSVLWILRHPAYSGLQFTMNRKNPWDFQSGTIIVQAGTYPAIVSQADWDAVQERMKSQKRLGRTKAEGEWLLQNMIHCAACGSVYKCAQHRANQRAYSCWGRNKIRHLDGSDRCTSRRFRAEDLEGAVWRTFSAAITDPKILKDSIKRAYETWEDRLKELAEMTAPIDGQLGQLEKQMSNKDTMLEAGRLSREKYLEAMAELKKKENALIQQRNNIDPNKVKELDDLKGYLAFVQRFWENPDIEIALRDDGVVSGLNVALMKEIIGPDFETGKGWDRLAKPLLEGDLLQAIDLTGDIGGGIVNPRRRLLQAYGAEVWVNKDGTIELRGRLPTQMVRLPDDLAIKSVSRMR